MKITLAAHGLDLLASDLVRSPGLHVSQIYNSLYHDLDPGRFSDSPPNPVMLALGTAWETHLEYLLERAGQTIVRPGSLFTPEGIAYSPDGVQENGHLRLLEYKLTWMSSRADFSDPKYDKYKTQAMSYCHHLETPYARFYVLYVNGEGGFRKPDPQLLVYNIEFTARELRDNWDMMRNHARAKGWL